ncbi:YbgA family protein [Lactobacillaceae bacterium Scapto_B20]
MQVWQQNWAFNKYWVMKHSQQAYNQIRILARDNDWTVEKQTEYQQILQRASQQMPTKATLTTAYQHVWGYFKKIATDGERQTYVKLLNQLTADDDQLGPFLVQLTNKYDVKYLLDSRIIQEMDTK